MSWMDRIAEAACTAPSGTRVVFDYEDLQYTIDKKTAAFNFPDVSGTYIQFSGHTGRQYPLRAIFWGDECDTTAAEFMQLLTEDGIFVLEHPVYGRINVVPFGRITRRDNLKTAANQVIVEITFWETIGVIYPDVQNDPASEVLAAVSAYNTAAAESFNSAVSVDSAVEKTSLKNESMGLIDAAKSGLQTVADAVDAVRKTFNEVYASINSGIDTLVGEPLDLAFQTMILVQAPARALTSISARLDAYSNLAESIINNTTATASSRYDNRQANTFHMRELVASTHVTGTILSVINNQFETKTDALLAANVVLDLFDRIISWREGNYDTLGEIDTGELYQQLQNAVALTAGYLVYVSFSLKQERSFVLDRARTPLDLVAQLYGSIDDKLDFFITSNSLVGTELLEIPTGREIVYYV